MVAVKADGDVREDMATQPVRYWAGTVPPLFPVMLSNIDNLKLPSG